MIDLAHGLYRRSFRDFNSQSVLRYPTLGIDLPRYASVDFTDCLASCTASLAWLSKTHSVL